MLISVIGVAGWTRGSQVPVALYLLLPGVLLGAVNRATAIRRAAHGLALDAEGVTLYTVPIHLTWSSVSEARLQDPRRSGGKGGVVFMVDRHGSIDCSSSMIALGTAVRNVRRSGGPLVLTGSRLTIPAEDVVSAVAVGVASALLILSSLGVQATLIASQSHTGKVAGAPRTRSAQADPVPPSRTSPTAQAGPTPTTPVYPAHLPPLVLPSRWPTTSGRSSPTARHGTTPGTPRTRRTN